MPLVFAAIAPHGGIAIAEACSPGQREVAAATRAGMAELGRRCAAIQADVGKVDDAVRLVNEGVAALGTLDILVNNAGIEKNASFVDVTEADYRAVIEVNMSGPFFATQAL